MFYDQLYECGIKTAMSVSDAKVLILYTLRQSLMDQKTYDCRQNIMITI